MPRIKTFREQLAPAARGAQLQNINPTVDTSRYKAVNAMTQAYDNYLQKVDETEGKKAFNNYQIAANELRTNYLNTGQQAAFDGVKNYREELTKLRNDSLGHLSNERQKSMVTGAIDKAEVQYFDAGHRHASTQLRTWQDKESDVAAGLATQAAITNRNTGELMDDAIKRGSVETFLKGQRAGLSADVNAELVRDYRTATNVEIIKSLLGDKNYGGANAHFEKYKDDIRPDQHSSIKAKLEEFGVLGEVQEATDVIWAVHKGDPTEAMKAARKIENPEVRKGVESSVKSRVAERANLKRIEKMQLEENISKKIISGANLDNFTVEERLAMGPEGLAKFQKFRIDQMNLGRNWESSGLESLRTRADASLTSESMKTFVDDYQAVKYLHLNRKDQEDVFRFFKTAQNDLEKGDDKLYMVRTTRSVVDQLLDGAFGKKKSKWGEKDRNRANVFHMKLQEQINQRGWKKDTPDVQAEIQKLASGLLLNDKDLFGDNEGFLFEQSPESLIKNADDFVEEIDRAERNKIKSALARNGVPVNDVNVLKFYMRINGIKNEQ